MLRRLACMSGRMLRPVLTPGSVSSTPVRTLPICVIDTNLQNQEVDAKLEADFCQLVAKTLKKPIELVTVAVNPGIRMVRGESAAPTASVCIWSVGVFDEAKNPAYSKIFLDFVASRLGLPTEKVTLLFRPLELHDAGHLLYAKMHAKK